MTALTPTARTTIKLWYFGDDTRIVTSIAGYVRRHFGNQGWGGDSCGCPDDRCIGYHHDGGEECQCLPASLDAWIDEQVAAVEAAPIWKAYRAAVDARDPDGLLAAVAAAEEWVRRYHGARLVSFSLDTVVDGRRGITVRNEWNDRDWLVWEEA